MANVSEYGSTNADKELLIEKKEREQDQYNEKEDVSMAEGTKPGKGSLSRSMNVFDAIGFFIGITIGSGIFITPSSIQQETGSFGVSMLCWLVGLIIAIVGGFCYIELALLIRKTGGDYAIIIKAYSFRNQWLQAFGSLLAFLFGWTSLLISGPSSTAIVALTCCRYLIRPFYLDCDEIPESVLKALSLFTIFLQAGILMRSVKLMAHVNNITTFLKVFSVIFIVLVGVAGVIKRGGFPEEFRHPFKGSSITSASDVGGLAIALYSVMWAFSGWDTLPYIIEELKSPEKNFPRAMVFGLMGVAICYLLVIVSFYSVLSYSEILATKAVALPFAEAVMGKAGLVIIPLLVAISTFGANLSNSYTSSRLIFSTARERQCPAVLCGVHKTWHTPIAAIVFHALMSGIYIVVWNVDSLIQGFNASGWVFYILVFSGLLVMRVTYRDEKRPFKISISSNEMLANENLNFVLFLHCPPKVWLLLPIIMIVVSVLLVLLPLTTEPGPSFVAFGIILSGTPVYIFLVMETPWKLRPAFLDRFSGSDILTPFTEAVMGKAGLFIIPLLVAISTFGASLSNEYGSSRLIFSTARERQCPAVLCGVHKTWHTPVAAIVFHAFLSGIYIVVWNVDSLIQGFNASTWVFYILVFIGLLVMRITYRNEKRPFKVWLLLPIIMIVVSVLLVLLPLTTEPGPSFVAFAVILSGTPVYIFLVMETPWKLRPTFLDRFSGEDPLASAMSTEEKSNERTPLLRSSSASS